MTSERNNSTGTPLARKLGLKPGMTVAWVDAPEHLDALWARSRA
jgi:hypothetical protein